MALIDETTNGVFTIAATPFRPDGALDLDSIDRLVDFYIEKGATGLTILGMMGEAGKLSSDEAVAVTKRFIARSALPVVVGVSSGAIASIRALSNLAMDQGAAGVMVAPPNTLRTDDQITGYFQLVADTLGPIPWVLQDFPLATTVQITPGVCLRIFETCANCVMLKHEDWPGLEKITALRDAQAAGARRVSILCGNGGLFLIEEMLRGADGAMTGFAYPEMMADVIAALRKGDEEHARALFEAYLPLIRYEGQPGLGQAIRKHTLARRGAIAHATARRPTPMLSNAAIAELDTLIARQDAKLAALR
jgi:4-hydroxy-tetrahydrodipicolinate synthase